jgi:hypothetical protein
MSLDDSIPSKLLDYKIKREKALDQLFHLSEFQEVNITLLDEFPNLFFITASSFLHLLPKTYYIKKSSKGSIYYMPPSQVLKHHESVCLPSSCTIQVYPFYIESGQRNPLFLKNKVMVGDKESILQVGSNDFVNQVLILSILMKLNIPHICKLYDAFYTISNQSNYLYPSQTNHGYLVLDYANQKDLSEYLTSIIVNESLLTQIVYDVLLPLGQLKNEYGFHHGDLKTKNVLVKNHRFLLADFDKSSLFYHNLRFYNHTYDYQLEWWTGFQFNLMHDPHYDYYIIPETILPLHPYIMSNPYGFYLSFDLYTFFFSLILEKNVYLYLSNNPNSTIWCIYEYLFHNDEKEEWDKFQRNLFDIHQSQSQDKQSIKFIWNQFVQNKYKLHYEVQCIYKWMGVKVKVSTPSGTSSSTPIYCCKNNQWYLSS